LEEVGRLLRVNLKKEGDADLKQVKKGKRVYSGCLKTRGDSNKRLSASKKGGIVQSN